MTLGDEDGAEYNVHFCYGTLVGLRTTHCTIHRSPCLLKARPCGTVATGMGFAACSRSDEFKKRTGRKIALARAMADLGIPRLRRAALWASYLSKVGHC